MSPKRNWVRKQVTETKEGYLELWREEGKGNAPGENKRGVGKGTGMILRESLARSSILRVFFWRSQGRIPIKYLSAF